MSEVKLQRKLVLEFLEPQYCKITTCSTAVVEFIKDQKTPGGMLDITLKDRNDVSLQINLLFEYTRGFVLVKEYA